MSKTGSGEQHACQLEQGCDLHMLRLACLTVRAGLHLVLALVKLMTRI